MQTLLKEAGKLPSSGGMADGSAADATTHPAVPRGDPSGRTVGQPIDMKLASLFDITPPPEKVEVLVGPGPRIRRDGRLLDQAAQLQRGRPEVRRDLHERSGVRRQVQPETIEMAYKKEIDQGILKVEDVEMRVVRSARR